MIGLPYSLSMARLRQNVIHESLWKLGVCCPFMCLKGVGRPCELALG